jgi:hypothetical protein
VASHDLDVVADEWQRRCELYVVKDRRWKIAVLIWLFGVGSTALCGYFLGDDEDVLYLWAGTDVLYLWAGTLFSIGLPIFIVAAISMRHLLKCPNCGGEAVPPRSTTYLRHPASLQACNDCGCNLA